MKRSAGLKAFTTIKDVPKAKLIKTLRVKLFNSIVLPMMLYVTWTTIKKEEQRIVKVQTAMGRSLLGILLHEHIWSKVIWKQSREKDVIAEYYKQKFCGAGHVARVSDNSWTHAIVECHLKDQKQKFGRPPQWWKMKLSVDSDQYGEKRWHQKRNVRVFFDLVWFGLVLWYINNCRLFNAKSIFMQ